MSTPTTQAASTPAASAAGNIVVASSATTGSALAVTSVVISTVTTPSSPKRTMSLGDYKKTRSGGDSTSSNTVVSRTGPVRDPWMPTPSEIQSCFGSTAPPSQYALYSCSGINDDDATKELDFDPATDQRRDYYIGLFHELRWYGNKQSARMAGTLSKLGSLC
ncbi:unnamed protein product [Phytophthora fragariaefolia]|uniref:Unnamed protein product n=1 Tax=Phytophthora fragariaefolia TaxID=1490495 RepID=A0A9W6YID0_9STRA|nr:unnamed protein product [Phytophthora fragariaefolia]